jgi:hypothetical protein
MNQLLTTKATINPSDVGARLFKLCHPGQTRMVTLAQNIGGTIVNVKG